jgi:aspartyl-tRNA(Asn)/glutamyl-tRNA(Gln) amidotransferase subunit C
MPLIMDKTQVVKLAELARIRLKDEEAEKLSGEFESILRYVGEVKEISGKETAPLKESFPVRNVMRADGEGHEPGIHTEMLLDEAPQREASYVKVKKIL